MAWEVNAVGERAAWDVEDIVVRLSSALVREHDVRAAWLFGSASNGRERQDSDLDVAVWIGDNGITDSDCTFETWSRLAGTLERAVGREVDLVVLGKADHLTALDAVNGKLLLDRDEAETLEFTLETARVAEDWALFLESFMAERRASRGVLGT